ncbi:N-methylhydantoinase B/oxoprolinase/acetone carboxylase alpha subunit [Agrobacterium larrymoorei]|uniref:N-methylhydantoinase B/oxoprolinase/acetone carboxylase alpha subunit n=1 Tax=Agrobacterium larrymoorei TaxID=160699 RepID=A0AAJ2BDD1_9HYPH|nr:hydantoinase B/oxoprolinase family protein [Agrobacterium larrymoorei]MDR6100911.1 N-methylhydantoinase B/oxoprolinase/acetone carboxylase alpha subunit [Agrobacterium larrymoorei]
MTETQQKEFDPVTFDIIQNALEAVANEMFVAQRKTSMSAIIYEVLDLSSGVLDKHGQVAASGAGIPAFIGVLDKAIAGILKKFKPEEIRAGRSLCIQRSLLRRCDASERHGARLACFP